MEFNNETIRIAVYLYLQNEIEGERNSTDILIPGT